MLSMLTRNNFLPSADMETRRGAYLNALKIAKLLLTAVGFGHVKAVAEACQPNAEGNIPVSPVRPHTELAQTCITSSSIVDCHISTDMSLSLFTLPSPALHCLQINQATHDQALVLQSALQNIPNPASECMLRNVAIRLAQQISDEVTKNLRGWMNEF